MIKEIELASVDFSTAKIVRQKRERAVFQIGDLYYKVWAPNWTQGDITKHGIDSGFYDKNIASALTGLLVDGSGQRGYVCKPGKPFAPTGNKDWSLFLELIPLEDRKEFMKQLLTNALVSEGIFVDLVPNNMILCEDKISLIDFDSYSSFNFVFNGEREWYEKFDLDAWWNPLQTAQRDLDAFYKSYFSTCLDIQLEDEKIASLESVKKMLNLLK